jgi:CDP-glycerol glycerophosphotransferase (TagB/SpsB family)
MLLTYALKKLAKRCIGLLDLLVPKDPCLWIFYITPDTRWDANMQCVYALASERRDLRCLICIIEPEGIPADYRDHCIRFQSPGGFALCLRAGVVFTDHALIPGLTARRRWCVNLWHGVPIKAIRYFCPQYFPAGYLQEQSRSINLLISSSDMDQAAMSAGFHLPMEQVAVTGLPRNDLLINPERFLPLLPHLERERTALTLLKKGRRLVLYAPTYRGTSQQQNPVTTITVEDEQLLAAVLLRQHAVLGVRAHNFSAQPMFASLLERGLVVNLPQQEYSNTNLLLEQVDLLVTDYSSIWVDFLLKQRPVLGLCPDLAEYTRERGFLYRLEQVFPGPIVSTIQALATELEQLLGSDFQPDNRYRRTKQLFHAYSDGGNTGRVIDAVLAPR